MYINVYVIDVLCEIHICEKKTDRIDNNLCCLVYKNSVSDVIMITSFILASCLYARHAAKHTFVFTL